MLVSGGVGWGESASKFRGYTESVPRTCPVYFWRSRVGALGTWCGDSATGVGDWSQIGGSTPSEPVLALFLGIVAPLH